jgi:hypothetical protein
MVQPTSWTTCSYLQLLRFDSGAAIVPVARAMDLKLEVDNGVL